MGGQSPAVDRNSSIFYGSTGGAMKTLRPCPAPGIHFMDYLQVAFIGSHVRRRNIRVQLEHGLREHGNQVGFKLWILTQERGVRDEARFSTTIRKVGPTVFERHDPGKPLDLPQGQVPGQAYPAQARSAPGIIHHREPVNPAGIRIQDSAGGVRQTVAGTGKPFIGCSSRNRFQDKSAGKFESRHFSESGFGA